MTQQHVQYICDQLNVGVDQPADRTTPSNLGTLWADMDIPAIAALGPEWAFAPEESYDATALTGQGVQINGNVCHVYGSDQRQGWYFLLTRP